MTPVSANKKRPELLNGVAVARVIPEELVFLLAASNFIINHTCKSVLLF